MNTNPIGTDGVKEPIRHGTENFPLQVYKHDASPRPGLFFYNHWHEEAEILYVTDGEMEIVVGGTSILASAGTVVLIPPNLLHVAYQIQNRQGGYLAIVFHPDFIASKNPDKIQTEQLVPFFGEPFISSYVMDVTDAGSETVLRLLWEFEEIYIRHSVCCELMLKGILYQILYYLLQNEKRCDVKSRYTFQKEERKKKILGYIEENYQNNITLEEMADVLGLSKEQFCRFFKQTFRSTPVTYLNQYRINCSKTFLLKSDLPIIEVAGKVGFDSSNYFAIAFKKFTGMTPRQFRSDSRKQKMT